jgi:hypothetical protein
MVCLIDSTRLQSNQVFAYTFTREGGKGWCVEDELWPQVATGPLHVCTQLKFKL